MFSPTLSYSLNRLLLFAATLLVLWPLLGRWLSPLLIVAVAFLVSGVLSFWLLGRQRAAMGGSVEAGLARLRKRIDRAAAAEDDALDAAEPAAADGRSGPRPQGVDKASEGAVDSIAESDESR